jgi:hypothetical protein
LAKRGVAPKGHRLGIKAMDKNRRQPEPVGVEELKNAILHLIVDKFDGRPLNWETVEQALALAAVDIKQAALLTR